MRRTWKLVLWYMDVCIGTKWLNLTDPGVESGILLCHQWR